MKEDTNLSRRMVLSKFSNTPPFHMKSKDIFNRGESLRKMSSPSEYYNEDDPFCDCSKKSVYKQKSESIKNNERSYVSKRKHHSDTFPQCTKTNQQIQNTKKEIINQKILENQSQKPSNDVVPRVLENFRKIQPRHNYSEPVVPRNSIGKNIPSHSVMTNLLNNLIRHDNNVPHRTNKKSVNHQASQSYPSQFQRRKINTEKDVILKEKRIDKYTSTTGLHWQPECKKHTQNCNNTKIQNRNKPKCPMANMTTCHRNIPCKNRTKRVLNETVEILDSTSKNNIINYINPNVCTSNSSEFENDFIKNITRKKRQTKKPEKTKSFVRLQIDKYNKLVQSQNPKNHAQILNSVKEKVPRILPTISDSDQCTTQDWSDNYKGEIKVCFPKETKQAMEKLVEKTRKMSVHRQPRQTLFYCEEDRPSLKSNCRKLNVLPCHKNLLCNRGYHMGECVS